MEVELEVRRKTLRYADGGSFFGYDQSAEALGLLAGAIMVYWRKKSGSPQLYEKILAETMAIAGKYKVVNNVGA
jgi:hypothetical protein